MTEEPNKPQVERIARRQRVLKQGKAISHDGRSVFDFVVLDLSATGAKIRCAEQWAIPKEFTFYVAGDSDVRDAQVIWRRADKIGIRIIGDPRPAPRQVLLRR